MGNIMRIGDKDSAGVEVLEGSEDVLANGIEICRVDDAYVAGYLAMIGSSDVLTNGRHTHRGPFREGLPVGEGCVHGADPEHWPDGDDETTVLTIAVEGSEDVYANC